MHRQPYWRQAGKDLMTLNGVEEAFQKGSNRNKYFSHIPVGYFIP